MEKIQSDIRNVYIAVKGMNTFNKEGVIQISKSFNVINTSLTVLQGDSEKNDKKTGVLCVGLEILKNDLTLSFKILSKTYRITFKNQEKNKFYFCDNMIEYNLSEFSQAETWDIFQKYIDLLLERKINKEEIKRLKSKLLDDAFEFLNFFCYKMENSIYTLYLEAFIYVCLKSESKEIEEITSDIPYFSQKRFLVDDEYLKYIEQITHNRVKDKILKGFREYLFFLSYLLEHSKEKLIPFSKLVVNNSNFKKFFNIIDENEKNHLFNGNNYQKYLKWILPTINSKENFSFLLCSFESLSKCLDFLSENYKSIYEEMKNEEIQIDEIKTSPNEDIKIVYKNLKKLLNIQIESNSFMNIQYKKYFTDYIDKIKDNYNKQNLKILQDIAIDLYKYYNNLENNISIKKEANIKIIEIKENIKNIYFYCFSCYASIAVELINKKELNNMEIFDFLHQIKECHCTIEYNMKITFNFKSLSKETISEFIKIFDDEFIKCFSKIEYLVYMIKSILESTEDFITFSKFCFIFFPEKIKKNKQINYESILSDTFVKFTENDKNREFNYYNQFIIPFLNLLKEENLELSLASYNNMFKALSNENLLKFLNIVIEKNILLNEKIDFIQSTLIFLKDTKNLNCIENIIKSIAKDEKKNNLFLEFLSKNNIDLTIDEKDFFLNKENVKIRLLNFYNKNGVNYINISIKNIEVLIKKYREKSFSLEEAKKIGELSKDDLIERFKLLNSVNKELKEDEFLFFTSIIKKIPEYEKSLQISYNYYSFFNSDNQEAISELNQLNKKLGEGTKSIFDENKKYEKYLLLSKSYTNLTKYTSIPFYQNVYRKVFKEIIKVNYLPEISIIIYVILVKEKQNESTIKEEEYFYFIVNKFDKFTILEEQIYLILRDLNDSATEEQKKYIAKIIYYFGKKKDLEFIFMLQKMLIKLFITNYNNDYFIKIEEFLGSFSNSQKYKENILNYSPLINESVINILDEKTIVEIIKLFNNKEDIFHFFYNKKIVELRNLNEFVDDYNYIQANNSIDTNDIDSAIKLVEFLSTLQKSIKEEKEPEKNILNIFYKIFVDKNNRDIGQSLNIIIEKFKIFKDFYNFVTDKNDYSKETVKSIMYDSIFFITKKENSIKFECHVEFEDKKLNFEEILTIRDRALFRVKAESQKENSYEILFNEFYLICFNLGSMLDYLDEIESQGISMNIEYLLEISSVDKKEKSKNETTEKDGKEIYKIDKNSLKSELDKLRILRNKIEKEIIDIYKKTQIMTLINGRQISEFMQFLHKKKPNIKVENYLKYIIENDTFILPKFDEKFNNINIQKEINFELIYEYLKEFLLINNIKEEEIYDKCIVKDKTIKNGIYFLNENDNLLHITVIKACLQYTGYLPHHKATLLCHQGTTNEEMKAFLFRFIFCQKKVFFILISPENLLDEVQYNFLFILKKFYDFNEIKSILVIFHYNKNSNIIDQIVKKEGKQNILKINEIQISPDLFPNIEVIKSNSCGVGKSRQIKEESLKQYNQSPEYFPLGGDLRRNDIANRLINLPIEKINLLHIDLMNTSESSNSKMMDFLFSFLILRVYIYEDIIFSYNQSKENNKKFKINLKIEIPNGFYDFISKFPILGIFKCRQFSKDNLPKLIVSQDKLSYIQIISNCLEKYKNNKLLTDEIDEDNLQVFSSEKCQKILDEFFIKQSSPNYYSINSFVNILGDQLKSFIRCFYLKLDILMENGEARNNYNLINVRNIIINSFIQLTGSFTKGAYDNLLEMQSIEYKTITNFNEKKLLEENICNLAKMEGEGLSFQNLLKNTNLVFFNDDGYSLSIITNYQKDTKKTKEQEDLYNLFNSDIDPEFANERDLIDYCNLHSRKEEYLQELDKILNLNMGDPHAERKLENGEIIESLSERVGNYVFTSDNFIKMIIILLRERAEIPIILMGETGCGKTSLINTIVNLKKNYMEILNIHAGIDDRYIFNWMLKKGFIVDNNKENKLKKEQKIWVFLDEINTCNSMGLISEMMLKHTINGKKILENIIFIAACNPYRLLNEREKNIDIGLTDERFRNKYKNINLVYAVNPLPDSLLNFVINFGSLKAEDELKYIESMINPIISKSFFNKDGKESIVNKDKLSILKKMAINLISMSQNFIRNNGGNASVSLREVKRFNIFFEWFKDFIQKKRKNEEKFIFKKRIGKPDNKEEFSKILFEYKNMTNEEILKDSILLSIYVCYFVRVIKKELRKELNEKVNK